MMNSSEAIKYLEEHSYLFIDRLPYREQKERIKKLDEAILQFKNDIPNYTYID